MPNNCRIVQQKKLIQSLAKDPRVNGPLSGRLTDVSFALIDILQIRTALAQRNSNSGDEEFCRRLGVVIQDAVGVSTNASHASPGRDAQFELFCLGCANPNVSGKLRSPPGPDIEINTAAGPYVVEAKRVRSTNALKERAREAHSQIAKSHLPGILATDVSLILAKEPAMSFEQPEDAFTALGHWLSRFSQEHIEFVSPSNLDGKLVSWSCFVHSTYFVRGNLCGPFMYWHHTNICDPDNEYWRIAKSLFGSPRIYEKYLH